MPSNRKGNFDFHKFVFIGRCHCEHSTGEPNMNKLLCVKDASYERLDLCHEHQGCVGPTTPEYGELFLEGIFCSNGELEFLYKRTPFYDSFRMISSPRLNHTIIYILATVSCGGKLIVPDCSYCPKANRNYDISNCEGNCQFNKSSNLCEEKGKRLQNN